MVRYRVQPEQRPVALIEADTQKLLDNWVCSEDPRAEADLFHIHYLQPWETEIRDRGSGTAGEVQGNRTDHPEAFYPDNCRGGFGHSRSPTDSVLLSQMSAIEETLLLEEALQLVGRIHPSLSEYMHEASISALQDVRSGSASTGRCEPPQTVHERQPRVRQKKPRSTCDDLQFHSVLFAAVELWVMSHCRCLS